MRAELLGMMSLLGLMLLKPLMPLMPLPLSLLFTCCPGCAACRFPRRVRLTTLMRGLALGWIPAAASRASSSVTSWAPALRAVYAACAWPCGDPGTSVGPGAVDCSACAGGGA